MKNEVLMKILNIYTTSFYGSGLWDLYSKEVDRIYKAWNVTIRKALSLPNTTHRYLIEPLSGCIHPKVMLSSRLAKFWDTMMNSNKLMIRLLVRLFECDKRTVLGSNLGRIKQEVGGGLLTPAVIKKNIKYCQVTPEEEWRVAAVSELLDVREGSRTLDGLSATEVTQLIGLICSG